MTTGAWARLEAQMSNWDGQTPMKLRYKDYDVITRSKSAPTGETIVHYSIIRKSDDYVCAQGTAGSIAAVRQVMNLFESDGICDEEE